MAEEGQPDPLNEQAKPPRRWIAQALSVAVVITIGIVSGARIWQPVKRVEQKVAAPIRDAVKRRSPLEEFPDTVADACPAVAALHYDGGPPLPPQAMLLTEEGLAITTATLPAGAMLEAWLNDGQRLKATVKGNDPLSGITLLKLEGSDLPVAALADADLPRLGGWGFTLTSPAGRGCAVEPAIVSSDFVTEDAAGEYYVRVRTGQTLPPGAPFFSLDGRLTGLARGADATGAPSDHFVPIDLVTTVASYLMRGLVAAPNGFGLIVEDLSPVLAERLSADRGRGAVVVLIGQGSAAAAAGLKVGDVVLSAGNSPISSSSELNRALIPGRPIDLVITRGPDQQTQTISLKPRM